MSRRSKTKCSFRKSQRNMNPPHASEVTRKIMGGRSQKQISNTTGYSTSAISQLLNCKFNNVEPAFAQAIWDSREENCSVTEEEFLEAFGMTRITPADAENILPTEQGRIIKSFTNSSDDEITFIATSIIHKNLLNKQYPILGTFENYPLENNLSKKIKASFFIKTEISEAQIEWIMEVLPASLINAEKFLELLFAMLYVQSEKLPKLRYSVILFDRKIFNSLKEVYKNVTVDDYVSVILLDNKRFAVADEFIMPRRNTQDNVQSIFI